MEKMLPDLRQTLSPAQCFDETVRRGVSGLGIHGYFHCVYPRLSKYMATSY